MRLEGQAVSANATIARFAGIGYIYLIQGICWFLVHHFFHLLVLIYLCYLFSIESWSAIFLECCYAPVFPVKGICALEKRLMY